MTTGPRPDREALVGRYGFALDDFQLQALDALDEGASVLVSAPTGSGKTVIAEYAIAAALADGNRAFYTAPLKALSNQKYHELCAIHGESRVGLLTGDTSVNGEADVVVMTTEVLRNMIYARSRNLRRVVAVVLDEVHFLQDAYRGPVWEEVIIHLPPSVKLVCLSATVSNAEEVATWISTVRGPTRTVVEERRPVRLEAHYLVGDRAIDQLQLLPVQVSGRPNTAAQRLDEAGARPWSGGRGRGPGGRRRLFTPGRIEVVERLRSEDMLPAIVFIFSRNQCDEAARACLAAGMRLTTAEERARIHEIAEARLAHLDPDDLEVLGHDALLSQLAAGVAAHHAGMVPPFKEVVEACFAQGLTKVVFATETLAVGINMPARAVVIEKLTKYTGDHHAFLTPGEFTQLTGRAGRRGIDTLGHAVVLWSPFVRFEQVAGLVASRSFRLLSAFRPTYNMAANLVRNYASDEAHHLLNLSFAQYQSDRDLVHIEARLDRQRRLLADVHDGRIELRVDVPLPRDRRAIERSLEQLRPGDVVYVPGGRRNERGVVLATAHRSHGIRVTLLTPQAKDLHVSADDLDEPLWTAGHLRLPEPFAPRRDDYRKRVANELVRLRLTPRREAPAVDEEVVEERRAAAEAKARRDRATRLEREIRQLQERASARQGSVARRFDDVLAVLVARGYVVDWSLTDAGEMLARIFHESDLLVAEAVRTGLLDGLDAPTVAGLVSVFVYEHRSPTPPERPWFPSRAAADRWRAIEQLSAVLQLEEERAGLTVHRGPDPTFFAVAYGWAAGEGFAELVGDEELTGGDFVRTIRQLIDLLRQLALVAPQEQTRQACDEAAARLLRGVVADAAVVGG